MLQGNPDGSSVRNIFEGSLTEDRKEKVKDIIEVGFKFAVSEALNKFDTTASAYKGAIGEQFLSDRGASDQVISGYS